jgi:S1-C subfamily serine protease
VTGRGAEAIARAALAGLLLAAALPARVAALPRAEPRPAAERRTPVVAAVESARTAVVNVSAEELVRVRVRSRQPRDMADLLFGDLLEKPRYREGYAVTSLGSGVIVSPDGYVLTNNHVVERGARFRVQLLDGRELPAQVVGTDPPTDLAVLRVAAGERLPFLPCGRSADLMIGETVIAIGNPFGLAHTVTTGVVSAVHRNVPGERPLFDVVQTDASINPGNSGGPLVNIQGQLVAVNTAIVGERNAGIGFAVPIDRALRVAEDLIRHGAVREAYLGLVVEDRPLPGSDRVGDQRLRVVVAAVEAGSPAASAGLRKGDVVESVDGLPVGSAAEYRFRSREVPIGGTPRLQVLRGASRLDVPVRTVELSPEKVESLVAERIGIEVAETTVRGQRYVVARSVRRGSAAALAGVQAGDLVREVNSQEVSTVAEFRRAAARARRSGELVLLVQRGYIAERLAFDIE